ncbi:unnamed protein product [Meloidogyne enterolobii]|uniref:Uncharacterized protein n=1 Tax=Meloidogyne enterolobii TaxID=390850 RepID=A0ACB1AY38_MELEN
MLAEEANSTTSVLPLVAINNKKNSLEKIPLSSPTSMTTTRTAVEPPKKSRRRNYKRLLLGISFLIILFFLIALIVALIVLLYKEKSAVCLTPVCVHTAAIILNSMNATVDPCDDFFEYACGNWIKQHPIPGKFMNRENDNCEHDVCEHPLSFLQSYLCVRNTHY